MNKFYHKKKFQRTLPPINHNIKSREVRVVGENINQIMNLNDAVHLAKQSEDDLVCINDKADPPICKIMDYGKYAYEQKKKKKQQEKLNRQNSIEVKEIQFTPSIDIGDIMVKVKKIQETINNGDKVKLVMKLRGREKGMKDFCNQKFKEFTDKVENFTYDSPPKWLGNKVLAILKKSVNI